MMIANLPWASLPSAFSSRLQLPGKTYAMLLQLPFRPLLHYACCSHYVTSVIIWHPLEFCSY